MIGKLRPFLAPLIIFLGGITMFVVLLAFGMNKIVIGLEREPLPLAKEFYFPKGGVYTLYVENPTLTKDSVLTPEFLPQGVVSSKGRDLNLAPIKVASYYSWQGIKGRAVWQVSIPEEGNYFLEFSTSQGNSSLAVGHALPRKLTVLVLIAGGFLTISIIFAVVSILITLNGRIQSILDNIE